MRVKSMLIFIVLNIFLMLFSSVMFEYINLEKRLNNITTTINEAGESAVKVATASEELFSAAYVAHETSYGIVNTNCPIHHGVNNGTKVATNILMFDNKGDAHQVNTYALAYYYCSTGYIPKTESDFNNLSSIEREMTTEDVYTFLYGQSGTEYNSTSLLWANANSSLSRKWSVITASNSFGSNRLMNDASHNHCRNLGIYNLNSSFYNYNDFESYVRKVYECIYTTNVIKIKNTATTTDYATYDLGIYSYPVLLNMGLKLNGTNLNIVMKDSSGGDVSGVSPWNSILATYSNMTNDYFTSSFHWGKTRHFGAGHNSSIHGATGMYSKYFLTPNTLGVTYVPLSVLKPNFIGLLQTNIQLNKVSGGDSKLGKDEFKKTITESIGCVGTSVYKTSSGVVANDSQEHITTSNEDIINDGDIEYDLKSVKVKVEYFDCDFYYDKTIPNVISRIEGAVPNWKNDDGSNYGKDSGIYASQVSNLDALRAKLRASDTKEHKVIGKDGNNASGKRLVAKVTYRLKVHIPYHSTILQLMCFKDRDITNDTSHYDIRQFKFDDATKPEDGGHADLTESGVWYQYTTYYTVTR